jgi:hypothetical protein
VAISTNPAKILVLNLLTFRRTTMAQLIGDPAKFSACASAVLGPLELLVVFNENAGQRRMAAIGPMKGSHVHASRILDRV